MRRTLLFSLTLVSGMLMSHEAQSQGNSNYLNFETPQVKPLDIAEVGSDSYLLACNTPDGSVEIYRITSSGDLAFESRVPVGLEPVSVLWVPRESAFYTCNFVGDSLTRVNLSRGSSNLLASYDRTLWVGDEPAHAVLVPGTPDRLWVALNSQSKIKVVDLDLNPSTVDEFLVRETSNPSTRVLKEVRSLVTHAGDVYALDHQGEKLSTAFDLARFTGVNTPAPNGISEPLGTNHFNMIAGEGPNDDGDLYVVGQLAEFEPIGEEAVSEVPFGFVHSMVFRISRGDVRGRDLNIVDVAAQVGAGRSEAISQPTDLVAYYENPSQPVLFVSSFGTDRLVRITNLVDSSSGQRVDPDDWTLEVIDVDRFPGSPNPLAGPRGLALYDSTGTVNDRVFVLNRLDSSIAVIETDPFQVRSVIALQHDPRPSDLREGQRFLYDSKLSPTGYVSCASCHIDGRLDGLRWDLGLPPSAPEPPIPAEIKDFGIGPTTFTSNKGSIATQTFQGLVNWEAPLDRDRGELSQTYFSNAPYHWRGDRADFLAFGDAFEALLGFDPQNPTVRTNPVSEADMRQFERFVNSIHFPPNPDQNLARTYRGELGQVDTTSDGSGALLGLKAMHIAPLSGSVSCVHCHSLPEGSNNLITLNALPTALAHTQGNGPSTDVLGVLESAALRGIKSKEFFAPDSSIPFDPNADGLIETGSVGLSTDGREMDLERFLVFFDQDLDPAGAPFVVSEALHDFVIELDSGVAPMVGFSRTLSASSSAFDRQFVAAMENQAKLGNVGVIINAWLGGVLRGFYFDQSGPMAGYREETMGGPNGPLIPFEGAGGIFEELRGPDDRLHVIASPLGSERRLAHPEGNPQLIPTTQSPSAANYAVWEPNTANRDIPRLTGNWMTGLSRLTDRVISYQDRMGLPRRHEPPRKLRVAANGLELGAQVTIQVGGGSGPQITLPIYPIDEFVNESGVDYRVWVTAVEAEAHQYLAWMYNEGNGNTHQLVLKNPDGKLTRVPGVTMELSLIP